MKKRIEKMRQRDLGYVFYVMHNFQPGDLFSHMDEIKTGEDLHGSID